MHLFGIVFCYDSQSTTSKNNFVIWKFCAKDMNKFQQAFSKSKEVWWENVLWTYYWSLIVLRRQKILELSKSHNQAGLYIRKFRKSNIVPPPTNKSAIWRFYTKDTYKHIQKDYQGFIFQSYISHINCGHLMRRTLYTKTY